MKVKVLHHGLTVITKFKPQSIPFLQHTFISATFVDGQNIFLRRIAFGLSSLSFRSVVAVESPQRDDASLENDEWVETLHSAARGPDTNVTITLVNSLLDEGAESDEIDPYGKTPLQCAMEGRNKGAALALLTRGADINIRFEGFHTMLHCAAAWGNRNVITRVLDMGGDIAAVNGNGQTPMHCAVWGRGGEVLVRKLLSRDGDITIAIRDELGLRLRRHAALDEENEPM
jgi:ankyrin repeat protein